MINLRRPIAEAREEVINLLKREVVLMREILSSMYEEERALIEKNPKALQEVMLERDKPLQDLKETREDISYKMRNLIGSLKPKKSLKGPSSLLNFLEDSGFETCEVMLLADQIIALIKKMNVQSVSIDHLMQEAHPFWKDLMQGALKVDIHHPTAFRATEEKKRGIMLTVEVPQEELQ